MSVLSDAIKALDPAPNQKTELTLALALITELTKNKVAQFEEDIKTSYRTAGTNENLTAPITYITGQHSEYRAYIKNDVSKIATEVQSAITDFIAGGADKIVSGIAKLVTTGLTAILGAGEGSEQEMRSYYITSEAGALVRYDIYAWQRSIEATGITSQIENCMAIYASKASVNVKELDLNTFLLAYQGQLNEMGLDKKEMLEYITAAEQVYFKLAGISSGADTLTNTKGATRFFERYRGPQSPGILEFVKLK